MKKLKEILTTILSLAFAIAFVFVSIIYGCVEKIEVVQPEKPAKTGQSKNHRDHR